MRLYFDVFVSASAALFAVSTAAGLGRSLAAVVVGSGLGQFLAFSYVTFRNVTADEQRKLQATFAFIGGIVGGTIGVLVSFVHPI